MDPAHRGADDILPPGMELAAFVKAMEETAPTDAGDDVASVAATVITAATATEATAETAGAEPAETPARCYR